MATGSDRTDAAPQDDGPHGLTRRRLLERAAAAGIVVSSSGLLGSVGEAWAATTSAPRAMRLASAVPPSKAAAPEKNLRRVNIISDA